MDSRPAAHGREPSINLGTLGATPGSTIPCLTEPARLRAVDPGFHTDNVIRLSVELPESVYPSPERLHAFHEEMLARLTALPNVSAAGVVNWLPLGDMHLNGDFKIDGGADTPSFNVDKTTISPGYFRAMGIRLLRGREFNERAPWRRQRRQLVADLADRAQRARWVLPVVVGPGEPGDFALAERDAHQDSRCERAITQVAQCRRQRGVSRSIDEHRDDAIRHRDTVSWRNPERTSGEVHV